MDVTSFRRSRTHIQVAFTTSRRRADHGGEGWQWLARGILDQPGG
jgi:hypothetical protein